MKKVLGTIGVHGRTNQPATIVMMAAAAAMIAIAAGYFGSLRVNLTPSKPLGLWRIVPLDRPVAVGDGVFICPPATDVMLKARARGYLRSGLCPVGFAPLIKTVIAVSGQCVEIGTSVRVEGKEVPRSSLASRDGKGRVLLPFAGGFVPAGEVFLYSPFRGSFDSRYFGPVPASGILGLAEEVLTYAP